MTLITIDQVKRITQKAFSAGLLEAERMRNPKADKISQNEAYRRFGEGNVKRWKEAGLITPQRTGVRVNNALRYSVAEIAKAKLTEESHRALNPDPEE